MLKKIGNLFDVKAWLETFVLKTVVSKGVKHAGTFIAGLLASAVFTGKVKPVLDSLGIVIDQAQLMIGLGAVLSGAAGYLVNWTIKVLDKDGDGRIG